MTIEKFVKNLSDVPEMTNVYNPYADPTKANNLAAYLKICLLLSRNTY